jgi:hypothetical protein
MGWAGDVYGGSFAIGRASQMSVQKTKRGQMYVRGRVYVRLGVCTSGHSVVCTPHLCMYAQH